MDVHVESKLIPALRDGVDVFKMILFKELRETLTQRHPESQDAAPLAAAVLNQLFGTLTDQEPQASFAQENRERVQAALERLGDDHPELRAPLTDALRMQFLCDADEGIESDWILSQAADIGLLVVNQEMPLPERFMNLARVLGIAHGILDPRAMRDA
jgi:hypothetical protein